MKGHVDEATIAGVKYKEGDGPWGTPVQMQTTDKLLIACANGRFYTLGADRLPGGRGFGEPVRSMIDLENATEIVAMMVARKDAKLLVAASDGRGFIVPVTDILAETRKGKQVVNLRVGASLSIVRMVPALADSVAVVGDNRKLLVFPLSELPEMSRGQGVQMQRYRDGGLSDAISFVLGDGLSWPMGGESGRIRTESDMTPWRVTRGAAGRMPPTGFPRDNRFG